MGRSGWMRSERPQQPQQGACTPLSATQKLFNCSLYISNCREAALGPRKAQRLPSRHTVCTRTTNDPRGSPKAASCGAFCRLCTAASRLDGTEQQGVRGPWSLHGLTALPDRARRHCRRQSVGGRS